MEHHHFLLVSYPAQGHINPCLQFAKHLVWHGVQVTFVTSVSAQRHISTNGIETPDGLKFAPYSDGRGSKSADGGGNFFSETRSNSSQRLRDIVATSVEEGCPVTYLVYNFLFPWAAKVAHDCGVPSSLLWIQPAAVLGIYYYYFNGYEEAIAESNNDPSWSVELPGLPPLHARDLPTFMISSPSDRASNIIVLQIFKELIEALDDSETTPTILVNTFDALEPEALKVIEKYNLIAIGPLIPSAFLGGRDPLDNSFGGDLFQKTKDYTKWLNSKPESSVVYVSFGSILNVPKEQMEEVALGLLGTGRPFLWVIRAKENGEEETEEDRLSCMEELEQQGKIVPWCSQLEVLSHTSLGCFVTHCGWNSTLESLASGVPVVAFPHWSDQGTNSKMMADVWRIGVRVMKNEEGIVTSGEVKRCIEIVMGDEEIGEKMKRNAKKWKDSARNAVKEGGSSDKNLKAFLEEFGGD